MINISGGDLELCDGEVLLLLRDLPGSAVCTLLPDLGDDVLRIVVDPTQPDAMAHVLLMLRDECDDPITLEQLASRCRPGLNQLLPHAPGLTNPQTARPGAASADSMGPGQLPPLAR
ncbi:hypothetical protein [Geodermatophilus sp. URMC 62]|uniref:hypothetical protein n=1 Tax=Geodermatophilus sp. URMC 62 TaxID=3423414 RepID=UPI00406C4D26